MERRYIHVSMSASIYFIGQQCHTRKGFPRRRDQHAKCRTQNRTFLCGILEVNWRGERSKARHLRDNTQYHPFFQKRILQRTRTNRWYSSNQSMILLLLEPIPIYALLLKKEIGLATAKSASISSCFSLSFTFAVTSRGTEVGGAMIVILFEYHRGVKHHTEFRICYSISNSFWKHKMSSFLVDFEYCNMKRNPCLLFEIYCCYPILGTVPCIG